MKKLVIILLSIVPLLGCQQMVAQKNEYIRNRTKDYLTSTIIAPLNVPPGLAQPSPTEHYPVPEGLPVMGSLSKIKLAPPGFGVVSEVQS